MKRMVIALAVTALLLPVVSCSDEVDEDEEDVLYATFTAANPDPGDNTLSLQAGANNGANFTINVDVTGVTDLYGVSYTLTYSPAILRYVGAAEGSYLATGGVPTAFQIQLEGGGEGRLVVGHTRVGDVTGVSGSGTLHSITFQGIAAGNTGVSFESARLADSNGDVIAGVTTSGGTASVHVQ